MTHWSDDLEVELNIAEYEEEYFIATFLLRYDGELLSQFELANPDVFKEKDYLEFADQKRQDLTFCDSNGYVGMTWIAGDRIKCQTSKSGSGGDGTARCYFLGRLMAPKIRELAERVGRLNNTDLGENERLYQCYECGARPPRPESEMQKYDCSLCGGRKCYLHSVIDVNIKCDECGHDKLCIDCRSFARCCKDFINNEFVDKVKN